MNYFNCGYVLASHLTLSESQFPQCWEGVRRIALGEKMTSLVLKTLQCILVKCWLNLLLLSLPSLPTGRFCFLGHITLVCQCVVGISCLVLYDMFLCQLLPYV